MKQKQRNKARKKQQKNKKGQKKKQKSKEGQGIYAFGRVPLVRSKNNTKNLDMRTNFSLRKLINAKMSTFYQS